MAHVKLHWKDGRVDEIDVPFPPPMFVRRARRIGGNDHYTPRQAYADGALEDVKPRYELVEFRRRDKEPLEYDERD